MEEFYIDCDGIKLHAKLERPEGPGKGAGKAADKGPLCILIHGFTGHMEEEHIKGAAKAMLDANVSVLRVEMYGHGKSGGKFQDHTLYKWVTNALCAVDYAKSLDFVTDLYLCGHSQGGLLTMLIGGMCPDTFKAIIPLSPAWMIPGKAREGELLGIPFDPLHIPDKLTNGDIVLSGDYVRVAQTIHPEEEMQRYTGPVLIIHGDDDDTVPFSYAVEASSIYKNAILIPVEGDDHCFTKHLDKMTDAVRDFFLSETGA